MAKSITLDSDDSPRVVPTLQEIRDLLKSLGSAGGSRSTPFTSQLPKILSPDSDEFKAAQMKDVRSGRINADAAGRAIPQLLKGDFQGAFNTRAGAASAQASLAGNAGAAEGILAGASKLNAAVAIASAAVEVVTSGLKTFREGVQYAGEQARRLAGNDHLGMLNGAVDRMAVTMEKIPIVGKLYGEALRAAIAPVNEFAKTVDAFVQRGKELSKYDTNLAAANARADTARTLKDIEEAKALGASIGKLTDAQSRIENSFRDVMLPIKELLSDLLASVAEVVADFVGVVKPVLRFIADMLKGIYEAVKKLNPFSSFAEGLSSLRKRIEGETPQNVGELNSMMQQVLQLGDLGGIGGGNQAAADRNDTTFGQKVSIPLFGTA